ncbi:Glutathione hydrolase-like YwrD proenzyme [Geodia barretti]|uniref:Glutathione hydrolase-like YwrD proenzyme n=1 Tax=Geodia barretti TaxID=519541 RepID=A0AA35X4D9_GEOBA|nr:Glutathione hydrolase-like YwrD proenzyme [Geodia barretti]
MEDLAEFSVKVEPPVSGGFRDYTVYTCNAWCQGPVVAQTLQMLEEDDLTAMGHNSTEYIHLVSQALDLAYADRHAYYGDPDLVDVPIEGLLSKGYTRSRRADVDMTDAFHAMPEPGNPWPYQGVSRNGSAPVAMAATSGGRMQDTSYVCAVDRWGNAFSATPSDPLAPSPIVPGLGIQMSSRGSQTWLDPEHPSCLEPWKRPRLTPNPAIAFKDGKLFMPFAGYRRAAFRNMELPKLILASHLFPGRLDLEGRIDAATAAELVGMGHDVHVLADWTPTGGAMTAIVVDQETGVLSGGADPRRDSYAIGR